MGVTEKMIGGRLFINFCGKNLVDASLIQNVRICAENRVEVIQRDILQNGTVSIDRFDMPEAQAILDWMNRTPELEAITSRELTDDQRIFGSFKPGWYYIEGIGDVTHDELQRLSEHRIANGLERFSKEHLEYIRSPKRSAQ